MTVNEAGHKEMAVEIVDVSGRADERGDAIVGADVNDKAITDGNGLGNCAVGVSGKNRGVAPYSVCRALSKRQG